MDEQRMLVGVNRWIVRPVHPYHTETMNRAEYPYDPKKIRRCGPSEHVSFRNFRHNKSAAYGARLIHHAAIREGFPFYCVADDDMAIDFRAVEEMRRILVRCTRTAVVGLAGRNEQMEVAREAAAYASWRKRRRPFSLVWHRQPWSLAGIRCYRTTAAYECDVFNPLMPFFEDVLSVFRLVQCGWKSRALFGFGLQHVRSDYFSAAAIGKEHPLFYFMTAARVKQGKAEGRFQLERIVRARSIAVRVLNERYAVIMCKKLDAMTRKYERML